MKIGDNRTWTAVICDSPERREMRFQTIHPGDISHLMRTKGAILIDVREREAYQEYHHPKAGCCPFDHIDTWICSLPKNRPLIAYCDYGSTSLMAARILGKEGYEVYTVVGGIEAMKNDGIC